MRPPARSTPAADSSYRTLVLTVLAVGRGAVGALVLTPSRPAGYGRVGARRSSRRFRTSGPGRPAGAIGANGAAQLRAAAARGDSRNSPTAWCSSRCWSIVLNLGRRDGRARWSRFARRAGFRPAVRRRLVPQSATGNLASMPWTARDSASSPPARAPGSPVNQLHLTTSGRADRRAASDFPWTTGLGILPDHGALRRGWRGAVSRRRSGRWGVPGRRAGRLLVPREMGAGPYPVTVARAGGGRARVRPTR